MAFDRQVVNEIFSNRFSHHLFYPKLPYRILEFIKSSMIAELDVLIIFKMLQFILNKWMTNIFRFLNCSLKYLNIGIYKFFYISSFFALTNFKLNNCLISIGFREKCQPSIWIKRHLTFLKSFLHARKIVLLNRHHQSQW